MVGILYAFIHFLALWIVEHHAVGSFSLDCKSIVSVEVLSQGQLYQGDLKLWKWQAQISD